MNKIYTKRDSATAVLRKMGVNKADYKKHIKVLADGRFELVNPSKEKAAAKSAPKNTEVATKDAKKTITGVAQKLILAGKTNTEVFEALKAEFHLDDSKKYYPAWNRSMLRRTGVLKEPRA
jgi:hypothetical protein